MIALLPVVLLAAQAAPDAAGRLLDAVQPVVLASSSSSDSGGAGGLALLLAGPVSGTALYGAVHRYYRNADKTDQFETETLITLKDAITGKDEKVDEVHGTRRRRIDDDNVHDDRQRVARLDSP